MGQLMGEGHGDATAQDSSMAVKLATDSGVAIITLNRPETRNAFDADMAHQLLETCDIVDDDASIGAVVLRGEGGTFCSGADRDILRRAGNDPTEKENYDALGNIYRAFMRVGALRAPVIAAARGSAVGAGLNLLLATDLRIVSHDLRLLAGFLRIGLHPGGGHFLLMDRLAGRETTAAMTLFGEELSGRRAVEVGVAWEALPDAEVEDRALQLAKQAAVDPELTRMATSTFRRMSHTHIDWTLAMEAERSAQMWSLRRRAQD
jgi:enoyl-CoA hydratase